MVNLTDAAVEKVNEIISQENQAGKALRIYVEGGGCSGFQYGFKLDSSQNPDDRVFEHDGIRVLVDETSLDLLGGATLDFVEDLVGSYFKMVNPNAVSTCGCGSSFSA